MDLKGRVLADLVKEAAIPVLVRAQRVVGVIAHAHLREGAHRHVPLLLVASGDLAHAPLPHAGTLAGIVHARNAIEGDRGLCHQGVGMSGQHEGGGLCLRVCLWDCMVIRDYTGGGVWIPTFSYYTIWCTGGSI